MEEFKISRGIDGSVTLLFDSNRAKECSNFAISYGIKIVSLYPGVYVARDLKPILSLAPFIEGLLLDDKVSYDGLNVFNNLTFLSVPDNGKSKVDLALFPKLKTLSCKFSRRLFGLETCSNLKSLSISNFTSTSRNLKSLIASLNLEHLSLLKSDITSLDGIERYKNLKRLELISASKLESIEAIKFLSDTLVEVEFEKCKNIIDYGNLGKVKSIKKLMLSDSGKITSLAFVEQLPNLNFLSFWNTNVVDGNLEYCKRIEYVGFDDKRHYNYKFNQFSK